MKKYLGIALLLTAVISCSGNHGGWTQQESSLINGGAGVMRVLTERDESDSLLLRQKSVGLSKEMITSETYATLASRMIATVTSPEQDGVGIAAPQVGVLRRVVAVMRYDKDGMPFIVYPDIRITACRGDLQDGPEGCLSVPGARGVVPRYQEIDISYVSPETLHDTVETVKGYSAVIFQHECDHLDGVLYTDRAVSITLD